MEVTYKKIDTIIPYEFNNKIHNEDQINKIANSITEFGFTQPIVIDGNNIIIIGHGRYEAAKKLLLDEVPTIKMGELNKNQIKKLRILDNKLNESNRNLENLKMEIGELENFNIGTLEILPIDLFPELDNDEFNPDEYLKEMQGEKEGDIKITVFAKDEGEATLIRNDLSNLGYKFK